MDLSKTWVLLSQRVLKYILWHLHAAWQPCASLPEPAFFPNLCFTVSCGLYCHNCFWICWSLPCAGRKADDAHTYSSKAADSMCSYCRERSRWESLLRRWEERALRSVDFKQEKEKFLVLKSPMNKKEEQMFWSLLLGCIEKRSTCLCSTAQKNNTNNDLQAPYLTPHVLCSYLSY